MADIRATIRYWQNRGVRAADVGKEFRCDRSWSAIEHRMTKWMLAHAGEE
jgi:hypothetical protein